MSETVAAYILTEAVQSPEVVETWFDAVLHSTDATDAEKIHLLHECAAAYWQQIVILTERIQTYQANAGTTAEAMRVLHRSHDQQRRTIHQLMAERKAP